jgi:hypothetical protein
MQEEGIYMNKKFLVLTSIDGYRIRMRADTVLEYGDLYAEDDAIGYSNKVVIGEKTVVGSYLNSVHQDGESTHLTETVAEIDYMLVKMGCSFMDAQVIDDDFRERENSAEDPAKHWSAQSLNEHDSLFDRVWGRFKKSQSEDPSKWVVPERGGKELGDCSHDNSGGKAT